jgi:uncharacterized protein YkwD
LFFKAGRPDLTLINDTTAMIQITPPWVVCTTLALGALSQAGAARAADPDPAQAAAMVVERANAFRRENRLPAVETDSKLTQAARDFAGFMARTGKFGHAADGAEPAQRARRHGYDYCLVAENIGYQYRSGGFRTAAELAAGFVDGWKRSAGHRKNLLDRDATETGVAIARSRGGRYYAVQMLGRPASSAVEFTVANESDARLEYRVGSQRYFLPRRSIRTHQECAPEPVAFRGRSFMPKNGERLALP